MMKETENAQLPTSNAEPPVTPTDWNRRTVSPQVEELLTYGRNFVMANNPEEYFINAVKVLKVVWTQGINSIPEYEVVPMAQ